MIRNKVLGSSAPHAVFVFGGSGGPLFPHTPQVPRGGGWPRPHSGRWLPKAYG